MFTRVSLMAALLAFAIPAFAEDSDRVEIIDYASMKYKLVKPEGYDKAKAYPALISLHGDVPTKPIKEKPSPEKDNAYGFDSEFEASHPAFVVIPRATRPWWDGGESKSPLSEIKDFVDKKLAKEYNIDRKRLYIVGYSDGGTGILHALSWYPNYFAGAIPMSGWLSWETAPNKMARSKTCVWWFAGKNDSVSPWKNTERIIKEFQKAKGHLKVSAIENGNHGAPPKVFNEMRKEKQTDEKIETILTDGKAGSWKDGNPMEWLFAQKL